MLTSIHLNDFKAFHELDLELRPLTVLLGPNNAGKSSVLAPVRLLAQTLASADPAIPLLLDGPMGDFGTYRDLVYGNHRGRPLRIGLKGTTSDRLRRRRAPREHADRWAVQLEFKFRPRRRQLILREADLSDNHGHLVTITYVPDSDRHVITRLGGRAIDIRYRSSTPDFLHLMHFLPFAYFPYGRPDARTAEVLGGLFEPDALRELSYRVDLAASGVRETLLSTEYISAMRLPPERTYHDTGEARTRIGRAGQNWAGILVLDSSRTGEAKLGIQEDLGRWITSAGLGSEIKLNWLSDRHYEVLIRHPITDELENLADVGQANSQVIPVLLGGLRLTADSTYMVEEPEIHLHPRAQAELGEFFVELVDRGVSSIVETHSEYLLLRLQQRVASGDLDPNAIGFYYVSANPATGQKEVKRLTLDERARFVEPLDGGFFPQRLEEARKLAQLRAG